MTRIVIVDPQPAARAGLAMLLRAEPGLVPVGTATGAHDGADLVARRKPDVVLGEHRLPDGDGPALTRRLRALENPPQVILYTAEPDPSLGLLARVAGAAGLVDKQAEPAELFEAVRVVARGGTALPPVPPRSWTRPRTSWTPTTSRCSRCSSTARRPGRSRTRCGWTAGACSGAPSACSGGSATGPRAGVAA